MGREREGRTNGGESGQSSVLLEEPTPRDPLPQHLAPSTSWQDPQDFHLHAGTLVIVRLDEGFDESFSEVQVGRSDGGTEGLEGQFEGGAKGCGSRREGEGDEEVQERSGVAAV